MKIFEKLLSLFLISIFLVPSALAMFTQPDSQLPDIYDPQQLNRYAYARNNPYKYIDPTGHQPESPAGAIEEANKVMASYLYGLERKRMEEDKRYEKLYDLYHAENPELPSNPYINVMVSAGGSKTTIERQRRISLESLETWNSGKLSQYSNQPAVIHAGDQLPTAPPKVSTPLDSGSSSSSGSSGGGILSNIWNWFTGGGGNDDSSSSSSPSEGGDSSDSSSSGGSGSSSGGSSSGGSGGSSGGSNSWWCFWCGWF